MPGPLDDLDTPRWLSADLCAAAGIDLTTFKNWSRSEPPVVMMGERDRAAGGSGHRHLFTLRRVLQVAITAEFVEQGLPPRLAGMAAFACTDTADGPLPGLIPERQPGDLFPTGWTVVLLHRRRDPWVLNWHPDRPLGPQLLQHPAGYEASGIYVVANLVYARVLRALELRPLPEALVPELH